VAPVRAKIITLETAVEAIHTYNRGEYRGRPNIELDRSATDMFREGLGRTLERIRDQVGFIGRDYGGFAGFPAASSLAPTIAEAIFACRDDYASAAAMARPLHEELPPADTVETLCKPFIQPFKRKRNWLVWGPKFWHFLRSDVFPIEDSRVDAFFHLNWRPDPVIRYLEMVRCFRTFALANEAWLPRLREADGELTCDIKLWDKVFYSLGDHKHTSTC